MKTLKLAPSLELPLAAVTATFGLLAVRGAGKSNTAAVMAEEMFDAGLPFVVVDPVGSWYGLRSGADGTKGGGLAVPIFGGRHGDLPLERGAGELLADLVVGKRLSCVLDLSEFASEGDKKAFLLAFARRLYQKNQDPLHLFLEEADDYIPQRPMRDEAQLLRAFENIVRRGRARGLGITLITQRSAAVNKSVLTQVETLFAMRTTGPQDIDAIEAWVKYHQVDREVVRSLAGLAPGEAWVWSPHFLQQMARVQVRRRRTFDSGATPKNLTASAERKPATLADVDLGALRTKMAAAIERAKADDPKLLRARIAELERQVARPTPPPVTKSTTVRPPDAPKTVEILTDADRELLRNVGATLESVVLELGARSGAFIAGVEHTIERMTAELMEKARKECEATHEAGRKRFAELLEGKRFGAVLEKLQRVSAAPVPVPRSPAPSTRMPAAAAAFGRQFEAAARIDKPARASDSLAASDTSLGKAERAILTVLAQHPDGCEVGKLTLLSGYRFSGGFRNSLSTLRTAGYMEGSNTSVMRITEAGLAAIGQVPPLPEGDDLRAYWLGHPSLGKCERAVLSALFERPAGMKVDALCTATGYEFSGGFRNSLSTLRTAGLIEGKNTETMRAAAVLLGA